MKNILVTTDLTRSSDDAIKAALAIGEGFGLSIKIVHIHKGELDSSASCLFPEFEGRLYEIKNLFYKNLESQLMKQINRFQVGNKKVSGEIIFTSDIDNFDDMTDRFKADLAVIPDHDEEFDSYFGGSVSERLIRVSKQDVLIVKKSFPQKMEKILVPFALNNFSLKAIDTAKTFAERFGARLSLIHIHSLEKGYSGDMTEFAKSDEQKLFSEKIKEKIQSLDQSGLLDELRVEYCEFGKKEKLLTMINNERPDLIIMGASRKKGLQRLYLGSFCEYILRNGQSNMLITKN